MKVGTDGVLIGVWTKPVNPKTILDIGSGTGLISIMMAQRFEKAKIYSIEINTDAALESVFNFKQSKWNDRIKSFHQSFLDFQSNIKYDLIISNPPFFSGKTKPNSDKRKQARHNDSLSLENLIENSEKILSQKGVIALVLPFDQLDLLKNILAKATLYINRICMVKGNSKSQIKRILVEISRESKNVKEETLIIEKERHQYTDKYIELCKDFYLNF